MHPPSIVGLICEDIRSERSGQETIVGVFPSKMNVKHLPVMIPKLAFYIRIHMDLDYSSGPINTRILFPGGSEIKLTEVSENFAKKARIDAKNMGKPIAGIVTRLVLSPVELKEEGSILMLVNIGGDDYLCGSLIVEKQKQPISSTS